MLICDTHCDTLYKLAAHPEETLDVTMERLKAGGKDYEFHRYDGAGHGFWYYDKPMYRQEQAMDSWNKVLEFFGRMLA